MEEAKIYVSAKFTIYGKLYFILSKFLPDNITLKLFKNRVILRITAGNRTTPFTLGQMLR